MATAGSSTNANLLKVSASLKEGLLEKRQRGQSHSANRPKRLKFQHRYICLTQDKLEYFVDHKKGDKKPAGELSVGRIRIIEKVPDATFQKLYCFQVGDEKEVMYLAAKSDNERRDWMEAFRIAANLKRNTMLERYHLGAYGHVCRNKWSCCDAANRDTPGCQKTSIGSKPRRMTSPQASSSDHGESTTKGAYRQYTSFHGRLSKQSASMSLDENLALDLPVIQSVATCSFPLSEEGNTTSILEKLMNQDSDSVDDSNNPETMSIVHHIDKEESTDIDCSKDLPRLVHIPNSNSIESGIGGSISSTHHGSQMSLTSIQSKLQQEIIPEQEPNENLKTPPWKCLDSSKQSSTSEVTSAIFRGTNTLITAYKDGPVQVFDTGKLDRGGFQLISSTDVFGSVDTWKNYVAIGFLNLQLLNIDTSLSFLRKVLLRQNESEAYPYLVVFTPRGRLLSYNQSQPNAITLWPEVESLWSASDVESEGCLSMENANDVESLLVSPNPSQPWLAISTSNPKQLRIYDYSNKQHFESHLELSGKEKVVASFTPNGENILVGTGRNLTLYEIKSLSGSCLFKFPVFDLPITSLVYNLWSIDATLAVGLSNGKIDVYSSDNQHLMSFNGTSEDFSDIFCLAYSNDGETLVAVTSSGKVQLRKVPLSKSTSQKLAVSLVREGKMIVDSRGKQHISPDDGYTISIPPGAIAEGNTVTFKYGVVPDGPFGLFEFPNGVRPVSAILSLHPSTEEPLLKPIEIAQPHFIHCETQEDQKRLAVYKADCHSDVKEGPDGRMLYSFKKMTNVKLSVGTYNGDPNYPEGIPYAKYSTNHPCYLCIGEYGKDETDQAIFSLIEVKPKILDQFEDLIIHFCLPYFLPTCHKTIRDQYPEETYDLDIQSVKFASDTTCDPAIGVHFEEQLGHWLFNLQGGKDKKIYQNEVCFWEYPTPYYLKDMCQEKLYPPRFSILVRGPVRPDDMVKAEFKFPGAEVFPGRGEPATTIYLPLQAQRSLFIGLSLVDSESSVVSETITCAPTTNHPNSLSTQQSLQPAARAFKACMCDLDKVHPSQLAINLFSKDLIDDAYVESIQESMQSMEKDEMVIRSEILLKMYSAIKTDVSLYTPLHQVLLKLSPDSAEKFASEMSQLSREDSVASMTTVSTQVRSTSINFPAGKLEHDTHLPEPDRPMLEGGTSPLATPSQESASSE